MKDNAVCKWCGTFSPDVRVRVGDLEYHPMCAVQYYEKRVAHERRSAYAAAAAMLASHRYGGFVAEVTAELRRRATDTQPTKEPDPR